jgi:formylglycine-generating enzyme required for sulfatase activity
MIEYNRVKHKTMIKENPMQRRQFLLTAALTAAAPAGLFAAAKSSWTSAPTVENVITSLHEAAQLQPGERLNLTIKNTDYAFRWCPPGTFLMGAPENATFPHAFSHKPQHKVTLTKGFWMLETPMSRQQWENITGNTSGECTEPNAPANEMTWFEIQDACKQLNAMNVAPADYEFALPSEAQWEYACRAGTQEDSKADGKKIEVVLVGEKLPDVYSLPENAWHIRGLRYGLWEWCEDMFYHHYWDWDTVDPIQVFIGWSRVIRGGVFGTFDGSFFRTDVPVGDRQPYAPDAPAWQGNGVRLVLVKDRAGEAERNQKQFEPLVRAKQV